MSYDKLKTDINQLIEKLNELRGFIQINSERSANFKNYLKSSECRENKLKIYLSGAISDLKGLHVIEYNQYSTVDLLKVLYILIEIGTILEKIGPIHYCEMLKITLKTIKMMSVVHNCEKFHEAIEYFTNSFKISENLQEGIKNKDEQLLKLVNFHMKILSHGLLRLFEGSNFIGIRSIIADFVGVEMISLNLTDYHSKITIQNYRKEFRTFFWELLENPKFFQELHIYLLNILDDQHMHVFCEVCIEIVEQVILANKKSIYDNCLLSIDINLFKIIINALGKCSPNNYMNNRIDVKKYAWILSRLMLLNYDDSSKFEYMEHLIIIGVFSDNYLICILSMDIWLLIANELHAAERINYVYICENLNQATYNSFNFSKTLLKIITINLYNMLDSDSQIKIKKNNFLQFYSRFNGINEMSTIFKNLIINQSTNDNYYELIQKMQSLEFHNSSFEQYGDIINLFIHYTVKIDCLKFHSLIMCILNNIKNPKGQYLRNQLLNKFKLSMIINNNEMSSVMKLICLVDCFHDNTRGTKSSMNNEIKLLLDDNELLVRLIAYKSLELSKRSKIVTKTEFDYYTLHVSNIRIRSFHHCIKYRFKRNNIKIRSSNDTRIHNALYNVMRFSKILQDIPKKQLTTQHKIKIVEISKNLISLNVLSN